MQTRFKYVACITAASLLPGLMFAAETEGKGNATAAFSFNPVLGIMIGFSLILLFAIAVLGNVLKGLAVAYRNKMREKKTGPLMKSLLLALACSFPAMTGYASEATAAEASADALPSVIGGMAAGDFYLLLGFIGFELVITLILLLFIRMFVRLINAKPELAMSPEAEAAVKKAKRISFWDRFNKSVELEKEKDIVIDHDYDGIRELDNSLPPWWKYGFYFTILISIAYMWYYHAGGNGPSSYDEYVAEVQKGEEDKAAYLAKAGNNVDEHTVKMGDAASITAGATLYQSSCAACHAADGGGGVGPNLADDYWMHGGSISDVFKSIKYGWPDKGMKSWKDDFSPKQLADIASYIKSLNGTQPAAPKDPQGELYVEESETKEEETVAIQ